MHIDIAAGLFIGWVAGEVLGEPTLPLLLFGAFAAIAPDIDFLVWIIRRGGKIDQYVHEHRDLLHHPLIVSLGGGIFIAFFAPLFGVVWACATLWHFIHDTFDGGWGIRWGSPFFRGYFTVASHSPVRFIRDKAEQRRLAASGNPDWIGEYLRPDFKTVLQYLFSLVVIVALLYITLTR
jgi:hypothetical protein